MYDIPSMSLWRIQVTCSHGSTWTMTRLYQNVSRYPVFKKRWWFNYMLLSFSPFESGCYGILLLSIWHTDKSIVLFSPYFSLSLCFLLNSPHLKLPFSTVPGTFSHSYSHSLSLSSLFVFAIADIFSNLVTSLFLVKYLPSHPLFSTHFFLATCLPLFVLRFQTLCHSFISLPWLCTGGLNDWKEQRRNGREIYSWDSKWED